MNKTIKIFAKEISKKVRLDKYLTEKLDKLTRSQIKKIILSENVKINNKIIYSASETIRLNDIIEITLEENKVEHIRPKKMNINILHEDKDLIIINKQSGLTVHPGAGNKDNTLVNGLIYLYKKNLSDFGGLVRPGIVHRIDKDTSGLLVVAKNNISHEKLSKQFNNHTIKRSYLALVWGVIRPLNGKIVTLLSRSKKNRQLMSVSEKLGKKAITNYKTLKIFNITNIPNVESIQGATALKLDNQVEEDQSNLILNETSNDKAVDDLVSGVSIENAAYFENNEENMTWIKTIYWKLETYSCILVERNRSWFEHNIGQLENVWNIILKE